MDDRVLMKELKISSYPNIVHGSSSSVVIPIKEFKAGGKNVFLASLPENVDSLSVSSIQMSTSFTQACKSFRFGVLNKAGKAVVLIDTVAGESSAYNEAAPTVTNVGIETFMGVFLRSFTNLYNINLVKSNVTINIPLGLFKFSKEDKFFFEFDVVRNYTYGGVEGKEVSFSFFNDLDLSKTPHYLLHKVYLNSNSGSASYNLKRNDFDSVISHSHLNVNGVSTGVLPIDGVAESTENFRAREIINSDCYFEKSVQIGFPDNGGNSKFMTFRTVKKVYNQDTFNFFQENLLAAREVYYDKMRNDFIQSAFKMVLGELPKSEDLNKVIENLAKVSLNEKNKGHYDEWELPRISADSIVNNNIQ